MPMATATVDTVYAALQACGGPTTAKDLAAANGWGVQDVADMLFSLRQRGKVWRHAESKTYEAAEKTPTVAPPPQPEPPTQPKEPRTKIAWPTDEVLLQEAEAIANRGGNVGKELGAKYGASRPAAHAQVVRAEQRVKLAARRSLHTEPVEAPDKPPVAPVEATDAGGNGTVLLLLETGTVRHVTMPAEAVPVNEGDQFAEPVCIDGYRRYRLWHCHAALTLDSGTQVRIMVPLGGVRLGPEAA